MGRRHLSVEHGRDPDLVPPDGLGDLVEGHACGAVNTHAYVRIRRSGLRTLLCLRLEECDADRREISVRVCIRVDFLR